MMKTIDPVLFDDDAIEDKDQLIIAVAAKMMEVYHERHSNDNVKDDAASAQVDVKGEVQSDSDVDDGNIDAAGEGSAGSIGG